MAAKYSSVSSSGAASTMRATLVLMLLLGAVVAAHGRQVTCVNKCPKPITCNGIPVAVNATVFVNIDALVTINVTDITNVVLSGTYLVPADLSELLVIYIDGYLKVTVGGVLEIVGGILHTLLGTIIGLFKCYLI